MSCDRLTGRVLVVSTTAILLAVSTGCLRTSIVRAPSEPVSRPATSAQPLAIGASPVAPRTQNPVTAAPLASRPVAEPIQMELDTQKAPAAAKPAAAATPMLDAAIERVEAVSQLELESAASVPAAAAAPAASADTRGSAPETVSKPPAETITPAPAPSSPTAVVPISLPAAPSEPPRVIEPPIDSDPAGPQRDGRISTVDESQPARGLDPQPAADAPPPVRGIEEQATFALSELRLCSKVRGFGSIEAIDQTSLRAGQRLFLYCEVTGVQYESTEDAFRSRLASRIEIKSAESGLVLWDYDLESAEDLCRHRRRDYFVNYLLELPRILTPGNYQLRLIQRDLVANRSTSAEIPMRIVP